MFIGILQRGARVVGRVAAKACDVRLNSSGRGCALSSSLSSSHRVYVIMVSRYVSNYHLGLSPNGQPQQQPLLASQSSHQVPQQQQQQQLQLNVAMAAIQHQSVQYKASAAEFHLQQQQCLNGNGTGHPGTAVAMAKQQQQHYRIVHSSKILREDCVLTD